MELMVLLLLSLSHSLSLSPVGWNRHSKAVVPLDVSGRTLVPFVPGMRPTPPRNSLQKIYWDEFMQVIEAFSFSKFYLGAARKNNNRV